MDLVISKKIRVRFQAGESSAKQKVIFLTFITWKGDLGVGVGRDRI